jgi:hypothetical protein
VIIEPLLEILRDADVNTAGAKAKKIDDARALRRGATPLAQGHSLRFGHQRIHVGSFMPAAGHEQAVLERRVEWLPGLGSNQRPSD